MNAHEIFPEDAVLLTGEGRQISREQIQEWLNRQAGCSMARGHYDRLCDPTWAKNCERITLIPLNGKGYPVGLKPWPIYVEAPATCAVAA